MDLLRKSSLGPLGPLPNDLIERHRAAFARLFPLAAVFLTPTELDAHLVESVRSAAASSLVGMFLPADKLCHSQQLEFEIDAETSCSTSAPDSSGLVNDINSHTSEDIKGTVDVESRKLQLSME
ncbi:unnamed protein product [Protopolystoma xenopodis]|uniref:Uncharacterized protein n=1 Tax=Protopolystoma xenopodis TaxID=117903 RepID=A0A448X4J4_9PLAT|nr:unnamed protein product [Protopolystoma xenopodis]